MQKFLNDYIDVLPGTALGVLLLILLVFLFLTVILWCFLPWILWGQTKRLDRIERTLSGLHNEMASAHGTLLAIERNTRTSASPYIPAPAPPRPISAPGNPFAAP
jgi:hypothetical protein